MKKNVISIMVWLLISAGSLIAAPDLLSYHGVLLDKTGSPINGTVNMTFRIYDSGTGGTLLWNEMQSVQVSNGKFTVRLGDKSPLPASMFAGQNIYIGVQIGIDPEMTPRKQIATEAFVFKER